MIAIDWVQEAATRALSGHSLFGPSTLPRAMACTGSVRLCIENNAHGVETEYSREGSNAHELARKASETGNPVALYEGREVSYYRGSEIVSFTPDAEMCKHIQDYLDWCTELPGEHFVETRVSMGDYMPLPDQFGTADHCAIFAETLILTDLKYGQGEQVFAEQNEQLLAYALGFFLEWSWMYSIEKIVLRICQPRLNHYDVWECRLADLQAFATQMHNAVYTAMGDSPTLIPGVQCRFCPMSGRCKAQKAAVDKLVAGDFDHFDDPEVVGEALSLEDVGRCLEQRDLVKGWLRALEKQAFDALNRGVDVPGWKICEGRSNRRWTDEAVAAAFLKKHHIAKNVMYEQSLISPAQAEKLFKKGEAKTEVKALMTKPPGRAVLAPVTDRRPFFKAVSGAEFENFDVEDDEPIDDGLGE